MKRCFGPNTPPDDPYEINERELDKNQHDLYRLLCSFDMANLFPYFNDESIFVKQLAIAHPCVITSMLQKYVSFRTIIDFQAKWEEWRRKPKITANLNKNPVRATPPMPTVVIPLRPIQVPRTSPVAVARRSSVAERKSSTSSSSRSPTPETNSPARAYEPDSIEAILCSSPLTQPFLKLPPSAQLKDSQRASIVNVIVEYHLRNGLELDCQLVYHLSKQIAAKFTKEDEGYYCSPRDNKGWAGKINIKYMAEKRKLANINNNSNNHTPTELSNGKPVAAGNQLNGPEKMPINDSVVDSKSIPLNATIGPDENVGGKRKRSPSPPLVIKKVEKLSEDVIACEKRVEMIKGKDTAEIFQLYPNYLDNEDLINLDFKQMYADPRHIYNADFCEDFYKKMSIFMMLELRVVVEPESVAKMTANMKLLLALFMLPHLLAKTKPNLSGMNVNNWISIMPTLTAFTDVCEENKDKRPLIAVIGSLFRQKSILFVYRNMHAECDSIAAATDLLVKCYKVLNLPVSSCLEAALQFVTAYFYEMPLEPTQQLECVSLLLSKLNAIAKIKN